MAKELRVLLIGDLVGAPGRAMFQKHVANLKNQFGASVVIVNGENSARGRGITSRIVHSLRHSGADVITSGNHIWHDQEIYSYLGQNSDLLRPANFPSATPGVGVTTFIKDGISIGVINVQGRVFMREFVDCPFKTVDSLLTYLKSRTNIIFVDFHAETTSEKIALGFHLDGKVTAVVGTHTHVQTADERILSQGTAFVTDLGMGGALNSMIGMKKESILRGYLTQMPQKFEVATEPPFVLSGVCVSVNVATGKAIGIERFRIVDEAITLQLEKE